MIEMTFSASCVLYRHNRFYYYLYNKFKHDLPQNGNSPVQAPFEEQVIDSDLWDDRKLKL